MDELLRIVGAASLLVAGFFALRKAYGWLRPLRIHPSISINFQDSSKDSIQTRLTNCSSEALYVTACRARSAYPWTLVVKRFVADPFIDLRFYSVLRFGAFNYELLGKEALKLEPQQPKDLACNPVWSFPLSGFDTSHFLVEVQLSSGRTIRSRSLPVPKRWHVLKRQEAARSEASA